MRLPQNAETKMKFGRVFLVLSVLAFVAIPARADSGQGDPGLLVCASTTFVNPDWNGPFTVNFSYLYDLTTETVSDINFSTTGAELGPFTLSLDQGSDVAWSSNSQGIYDEGILFYTTLGNANQNGGFLDITLYLPGPDGTPFGLGSSMVLGDETQSFTDVAITPEPYSIALLAIGLFGLAALKLKLA
jgi:hypothetical protein